MIHLAHVRIEAGNDPLAGGLLGDCEQRADADHADAAREREPLRDSRGDAQAGE